MDDLGMDPKTEAALDAEIAEFAAALDAELAKEQEIEYLLYEAPPAVNAIQ